MNNESNSNNIYNSTGSEKSQRESSEVKKQPFVADGVTGFIESLIRRNIVSRKTVNDAVAWKKTNNPPKVSPNGDQDFHKTRINIY
ncbi:MAG: hypothetical protein QME52_05990, partial [Bacteroidota bacterium]|nr:hypothetical protein [Bacteroidota bacterium]